MKTLLSHARIGICALAKTLWSGLGTRNTNAGQHVFCRAAYAISIALLVISCNKQAVDNGPIRINQVGFAPDQEMTATIVLGNDPSSFSNLQYPMSNCYITNIAGDTVWTGVTSEVMYNPVSGKPCQMVDFSDLTACGDYTLYVENNQISNLQFQISNWNDRYSFSDRRPNIPFAALPEISLYHLHATRIYMEIQMRLIFESRGCE